MDREHWQEQWTLFHAALEQPQGSRREWLAAQCESPMRAEVEALLDAHEKPSLLDPGLVVEVPQNTAKLTGWRMLRQIGEGGMGAVYLVEREGQAQRAALKVLTTHREQWSRFARECAVLARLEHRHVAHLIASGTLDDGRPYLLMPYIEGERIDQYCRDRKLGWRQIVTLVLPLLDAIAAAHQQLIVHRDIKPSNVLVDNSSAPVLLDFGIAKLLDTDEASTATPPYTALYAAPEQIAAGPVSTAIDIYGLGVLLHELLTGKLPHAEDPVERSAAAMRGDLPKVHRTSVSGERLPADLVAILHRAVAGEPQRRYSAAAFTADLNALLDLRPVAARGGQRRYRFALWMRRHWQLASFSLALILIVAGFSLRSWQEAERTVRALAQAQIERDRSDSTVAFLMSLFEQSDRTRQGGQDLRASELLQRGRSELERQQLPADTHAALLLTLADVQRNLGAYAESRSLAERALAIAPDQRGAAMYRVGLVERELGNYKEAERALQQSLQLAQERRDPVFEVDVRLALAATLELQGDHARSRPLLERAASLSDEASPNVALRLGAWHWRQGDLDRADEYYGRALTLARDSDSALLATALDAKGTLALARGEFPAAIDAFQESLALRRKIYGADHRLVAQSLSYLGVTQSEVRDLAAAEALLREAIAIFSQTVPDSVPLASAMNNLGLVLRDKSDGSEARTLFEGALEIYGKQLKPSHAAVAGALNNLGLMDEGADDLPAALRRYQEALDALEREHAADHPSLAFPLSNLGRVQLWLGGDSQTPLARALAIRVAKLPANHALTADTQTWFGLARCVDGEADGVELLKSAVATRTARFGAAHTSTQDAQLILGMCVSLTANQPCKLDLGARRGASGELLIRRLRKLCRA